MAAAPDKMTTKQRVERLEAGLQALAEDFALQVHGHRGPVEYDHADDSQGWLLIVGREKQSA